MLLYVLLGLGGLLLYKKVRADHEDDPETEDPFVAPIPAGDEVLFPVPPLPPAAFTGPLVGPPKPGGIDGLGRVWYPGMSVPQVSPVHGYAPGSTYPKGNYDPNPFDPFS